MTLTIHADNSEFLAKIKEIVSTLAKYENVNISLNNETKEKQTILSEIKSDIELFKQGKLETISHDELKSEIAKW